MKITICGSMAFYEEMQDLKKELEVLGHEVMLPRLNKEVHPSLGGGHTMYFAKYIEDNGGIDSFAPGHIVWDHKEGGIRDHFDKIDWCEAILVVNPEKRGVRGYVGGNTLMELGVAFYQRKPIYIMDDVSSELSYKQEIMGMKPIFLEGDVSKIPN